MWASPKPRRSAVRPISLAPARAVVGADVVKCRRGANASQMDDDGGPAQAPELDNQCAANERSVPVVTDGSVELLRSAFGAASVVRSLGAVHGHARRRMRIERGQRVSRDTRSSGFVEKELHGRACHEAQAAEAKRRSQTEAAGACTAERSERKGWRERKHAANLLEGSRVVWKPWVIGVKRPEPFSGQWPRRWVLQRCRRQWRWEGGRLQ